jgi:hypothetical protein
MVGARGGSSCHRRELVIFPGIPSGGDFYVCIFSSLDTCSVKDKVQKYVTRVKLVMAEYKSYLPLCPCPSRLWL